MANTICVPPLDFEVRGVNKLNTVTDDAK